MTNDMCIIIPVAGLGKRMKAYGPKASIRINKDESVLSRQIKILRNFFPKSKIIVVCGFQKEKIFEIIDQDISCVENKKYKTSNICLSIKIALDKFTCKKVLIVNGDLVFTDEIFNSISKNSSWIAIDTNVGQRSSEVGVNIVEGKITNFCYGLNPKWGQIVYLVGKEIEIFKKLVSLKTSEKKFSFELLNDVIDMGGIIKPQINKKWKLVEIDTSKDINRAKKLARRA